MWDHGLFDPIFGAAPDAPPIERGLRRALVHYPRYWGQLYGEDLIATSMAQLARTSPDARRLPFPILLRLWAGAARERFSSFATWFKVYRWFFTGHPLRGDDRWRARDMYMRPNVRLFGFVAYFIALFSVNVYIQSNEAWWLRTWVLGAIAAIFAVLIFWEVWQRRFNQPKPRSIFSRKLALPALRFTDRGVPLSWLPNPPSDLP